MIERHALRARTGRYPTAMEHARSDVNMMLIKRLKDNINQRVNLEEIASGLNKRKVRCVDQRYRSSTARPS